MEKCENCGHAWHGLVCTMQMQSFTLAGGLITEKCKCPPRWVDNPPVDD